MFRSHSLVAATARTLLVFSICAASIRAQQTGMQMVDMNSSGMHLMDLSSGTSQNPAGWPTPTVMRPFGSWNTMFMGQSKADDAFLEHESDAAVDDPAVKGRPGIYGPSPIHRAVGQEHRVPPALPDIAEVFQIQEQLDVCGHLPFAHGAKNDVWG